MMPVLGSVKANPSSKIDSKAVPEPSLPPAASHKQNQSPPLGKLQSQKKQKKNKSSCLNILTYVHIHFCIHEFRTWHYYIKFI